MAAPLACLAGPHLQVVHPHEPVEDLQPLGLGRPPAGGCLDRPLLQRELVVEGVAEARSREPVLEAPDVLDA